jgi:hypothetical protein
VMNARTCTLGLIALLSTGCPPPGPGAMGTVQGIPATCNGDLGASAAAQKVESFVVAVGEFTTAANELTVSLHDSCRQMGDALGVDRAELVSLSMSPERTRLVCERVSRAMRDELTAIRAAAAVRAEVVTTPPVCEISVSAYARCAAECDIQYTPGRAEIQCEGGELRGTCSATCSGRCAVDINGSCNGSCEGTCSAWDATGNCTGICNGRCVTTASAT